MPTEIPTEPRPAPPHALIHRAVAARARACPEATALVHGDEHISYRTLDHAADTYAEELQRHGVRAGDLVPVVLPRGPRLIALLLAVLKCGAGYAALERGLPEGRSSLLVRQLGATLAIGELPSRPGLRLVTPQVETLSTAAARRTAAVDTDVPPTSTATVFFTSGTTGPPKAVLSPHRATTRLFTAQEPLAGLAPGAVMGQCAPVAWDAFSLEVWGPLTTGATCVPAPTDLLMPDDLRDLITLHGVDTMWLTSSVFNLFVDEDPDVFAGLRLLMTGGEALSPRHVRTFLTRHPGITLLNGYGPVENCVFATTHRIRPADCDLPTGIPLGRPVPGTGIHLLDGEICLSGTGLATAYLADPEATADRFTTAPTADGPRRVYRTGDRGSRDESGLLHFHGRADRQLKIAGHRVEPAGIETTARAVPGIRDCAVVPRSRPGTPPDRLALFYVPHPGVTLPPAGLRQILAAKLPPPSVPSELRPLPALPLTANGKVDHRALKALPSRHPSPRSMP
ncbi:AMP-binding protein [Streptomyces sp. NPDC059900]|uniref:AMP-binding protein n=1 Tax=Streptomyces sp. NPDC059900 TaxID=3155816 RepID=UPI00343C09F0